MTDMKNKKIKYTAPELLMLSAEYIITTSDIIYDENETTGVNMFDHGEDM